jgi:hypothetical protein
MKEPTSQLLAEAERWLRQRSDEAAHDLDLDVEAGLVRHRELVRRGVALPEWSAGLRPPNSKSWLGIKLGVLALLAGALLFSAWALRTPERAAPVRVTARKEAVHSQAADAPKPTIHPLRMSAEQSKPQRSDSAVTDHGSGESPAEPPAPSPVAQPLQARPLRARLQAPAAPAQPSSMQSSARTPRAPAPTAPADSSSVEAGGDPLRSALGTTTASTAQVNPQQPFDAIEMQQVARAEQLLASDPGAALALVRAGELRFRDGYFSQERRYLEVMSLVALGRRAEAKAQGWAFLRDYRTGPYSRKLERVMQELAE